MLVECEICASVNMGMCPTGCVPGHFGPNCSLTCSDCPGECDTSGCVCPPGLIGSICELNCPLGFYGSGCNEVSRCSEYVRMRLYGCIKCYIKTVIDKFSATRILQVTQFFLIVTGVSL